MIPREHALLLTLEAGFQLLVREFLGKGSGSVIEDLWVQLQDLAAETNEVSFLQALAEPSL